MQEKADRNAGDDEEQDELKHLAVKFPRVAWRCKSRRLEKMRITPVAFVQAREGLIHAARADFRR
jgi:hypothetical protein